jgi:hypothetical protein
MVVRKEDQGKESERVYTYLLVYLLGITVLDHTLQKG